MKLNNKWANRDDKKLNKTMNLIERIFISLKGKNIPESTIKFINNGIASFNQFEGSDKLRRKELRKLKSSILKHLETELNMVAKNHYTMQWMALGIALFGVPLGTTFGAALKNMGLLGIGIPIGMIIGMAIGAQKDKQAFNEGRQLDFEL